MIETNQLEKKKVFKTSLHAAISYLIGMGIVESDTDVASKLEIDKSNLSAYKNGKKIYGDNFVVKFEKAYNLKLADFDPVTYSLVKYVIEKSGPREAPDQYLLTRIRKEVDNLTASLLRLSDLVPSVQEETTIPEVTFGDSSGGKTQ